MVDFGLGLLHGPPAGRSEAFLAELDKTLPQLKGTFRSIWMTDHFQWEGQPTFEAWTVLSYIAARYPEFEVGPIVLGQNYRNPALLALMSATLQALSGGRFIMGIGAGWKEDEYRAYDYPYPAPRVRVQQLEETLIILKKMWEEPGQVSYEGEHYSIKEAWCEPKPRPQIPILVGGGGYTTMKHAAKYADIWNYPDSPLDRYLERQSILRRHLDDMGRDPNALRCSWFGRVAIGRTEEEAVARGLSRENKWTRANAFVGAPQAIAEQMQAFVEHGCDYFIIDIIDAPDEAVIGMFIEEVIPLLVR
ncbi:MAG: LLM class flavin-dependent oxidoreductase [Chloroflexi bacterium]|nr:LLM class flavin-dependent oxidoreductase [Chloroflexota bacterium]